MVLMVTAVALRPWSVAEHLLCAGCSCESRAHSGGTAGLGGRFFFGGGVLCSAGCLGAALASPSGETPLLLCDTQRSPASSLGGAGHTLGMTDGDCPFGLMSQLLSTEWDDGS